MKNNNSRLSVLTIILFIIVTALVCFIICNKNTSTSSNTPLTTYNYSLSKRSTVQAVRGEDIEVIVDTDGDVYLQTLKTNPKLKNLEAAFIVYAPKGYESLDGVEFKGAKLNISNVLSAYYVHLGNGGFTYFVFITEDGKLAYLNYDNIISNSAIDIKTIDDVKNVATVVDNTYTMTPYAIDINGNEISLYEYIK